MLFEICKKFNWCSRCYTEAIWMTISCLASWYSELSHGWYAPDPLIDQDAEQERSENKDMLCSNGYDSFSIWKSCKTITTFLSRFIKLIQPKWQSIKPAQTFKVPKKINNGMIGNVIIAGEGLCSALKAIEQWGFFSMPHLLCNRASVYNGNLQRPVTLAPNSECLAVGLSQPVFTT